VLVYVRTRVDDDSPFVPRTSRARVSREEGPSVCPSVRPSNIWS